MLTLWSKSRSPQALEEELTLEETGYAPVRRIPASRRPAHPVHTSKGVKGKGNGERYIKGDWMKGEPIVVRQHNEHCCWRQERNERTGEIMDVHICESCGWVSCTLHRSIKPPRGWIVIPSEDVPVLRDAEALDFLLLASHRVSSRCD